MLKTSFRGEGKKQVFLPLYLPTDTGVTGENLIKGMSMLLAWQTEPLLPCSFETKRAESSEVAGNETEA